MTKFSDLKLDPKVLKAVAEAGYETPTPIQAGAIPPALEGRDVLGIAQTGTGKTASFTLPMITLLGRGRARARMPRSLVLCPTRELAAQVAENFDTYAKHTRLTKALLIGGVSFGEQDKLIDRGVDVLIATPGRLLDHFERGKLLLTGVQIMVVDEADRMLDMGFIPDIERIFQLTPFTRQTLFFSATMAPEIERITNTFLHAPARIEVARQATTSETITQKLVELTPTRKDQTAKQKRELLRALIETEGEALKNAIIFCNRKTEVDIVAKSLKAHGFDAAPIHGDLDQRVRMATLDGFRDGTLRFLVASDVAARGLDIPAVSHVFNFDLPSHAEDYVHRIGRTGRAGRLGTAYSIGTPADEKYLAAIENLVKHELPRAAQPDGFSLSEAAKSAPRPASDRGGRGPTARTRGRRGEGRGEGRGEARGRHAEAETEIEVIEAATPVVEDSRPAQDESRAERPTERAPREDRRERADRSDRREGRDDNRDDRREDRGNRDDRNDRRDRGGDRGNDRRGDRGDRGHGVTGMGDHTPDFLLTSFAEAIAATDARMAASGARAEAEATRAAEREAARETARDTAPDTTQDVAEPQTAVPAGADTAEDTPAKPKRSRSRRKPKADAAASDAAVADTRTDGGSEAAAESGDETGTEAAETATALSDAAAPDDVPVAADAEAPAKPKRTRTRRTPAARTDAAEADAALNDAAATDTTTTVAAAASEPDTPPADAPAAEAAEAPKPKRTRRRKTDPAPDTEAASDAQPTAVAGDTEAAADTPPDGSAA